MNGLFTDPPISVSSTDVFGISFAYDDADCNLPGGLIWLNLNNDGFLPLPDPLPDEIGCSTAESGFTYGFDASGMAAGSYTFAVYWTDVCDAASDQLSGDWIVASK